MGKSIIEITVEILAGAGFHAQRAYPGTKMPHIADAVLAVDWEELNQKEKTATLRVSVLSPASHGAAQGQDCAVAVCRCLRGGGGCCTMGKTAYKPDMQVFFTEILAVFFGEETVDGWVFTPEESEEESQE